MTLVNTLANACYGVMMQIMLYLVDWVTFKRCLPFVPPTTSHFQISPSLIAINISSVTSANASVEPPFICYTDSQIEVSFSVNNDRNTQAEFLFIHEHETIIIKEV